MKNNKWEKFSDRYKFQLGLSKKEKDRFESICFHKNTTKTLFLRDYINRTFDEIEGEKSE